MAIRRSLFFSFVDRYASLMIAVVTSMVIARLLTPTEIGVFSVTMVLLALVNTVRDLGAGQYLIQEKDLTIVRIRAVWTVQLGLGLGLACIVAALSEPVSLFYDEPRMRDIMLVVALNYALNPFGSLTYAWLMREMRFKSIALMRFSAVLGGAVVSILLAWHDHGPISLAFGSLTGTTINALIAAHYRPRSFPWLPGIAEIRRVLAFGSQLTFSSIVSSISIGTPELLLGKLQDLTAAGFYSRSNGLVQMFRRLFVEAVAAVCLPWFAKQLREQGGVVDPFLKATAYVTACGWSFCLAIICMAHPIVRVLYGDQWDQSVDLARLLAVAIALQVPAALCTTALLSSGGVTIIARVTVLNAFQNVVFVAFGAWQGLEALGIALIAAAAVTVTLWLRATTRHVNLPFRGLLPVLCKSAAVALMAAIGPALALWMYGPYPEASLAPLALGTAGGLAGFVAGVLLVRHPLQTEFLTIWSRLKR